MYDWLRIIIRNVFFFSDRNILNSVKVFNASNVQDSNLNTSLLIFIIWLKLLIEVGYDFLNNTSFKARFFLSNNDCDEN